MQIENKITIVFSFALATAFACTRAKSPTSDAIERAKVVEPTLTSTAPVRAMQRVSENRFEQATPEIAEPMPVEDTRAFEPELGASNGLTIHRLVTATGVDNASPSLRLLSSGPMTRGFTRSSRPATSRTKKRSSRSTSSGPTAR